jgi:protocatechuate 3,4-dioxygenase beta subunit
MRRVAFAFLTVCVAAVVAARAQSSRDQPGSAATVTLTGRVIAEGTGDAVPNVRVTLATAPNAVGAPIVLTDADGRFALKVPAGRHTLAVAKTGYARRELPVPLPTERIEIRLQRGAAISGRVVDEFGDPSSVRVSVEPAPSEPKSTVPNAAADTDDRGEYRVGSLAPGVYVVAVQFFAGPRVDAGPDQSVMVSPVLRKIYYPGVATADAAEALRVESGAERPAVDFVVRGGQSVGNPFSVTRISPPILPPSTAATAPPPPATGTIRGRVVSTDGRALPFAELRAVQRGVFGSRAVRAGEDGQYEFRELPAGRFQVMASKSGFAPVPRDGASAPLLALQNSGQLIDLKDGETRERVDITLMRWGSLAGQVFDELGDPVEGANVQVLQIRYEAGRRRLVPAGSAPRVTDDLGRYRLFALPPGNFIVAAGGGDVFAMNMPGYTRSYFPSTPNAGQAQFVPVRAGQDVVGIDISLSRIQTARVTGRMIDSKGEPTTGGTVNLVPSQRSTAAASVPIGARIAADGAFEFPNVPPGQYVIQAYRGRQHRSVEGEFGALQVAVAGTDVAGLMLQTSSGSSIAGRITFDTLDRTKLPSASAIELSPVPIDFDASPASYAIAEIRNDATFDLAGINGPRRLHVARAPTGWALKQIFVNGIDVTDRPLPFGRRDQSLRDVEVVLTDRVSEVAGTVADDRGQPVPESIVVVFSTDRDRWYPASRFLARAVAAADGAYSLAGLPFGSYYAAAASKVPIEGEDSWQDPEFLNSLLPAASSIVISEGQKQSLNLRVPR